MVLTVLLECKAEKRNSQCEHGQPMEQTNKKQLHEHELQLSYYNI